MDAIDKELGVSEGPYFLGDDVMLPDLVFAPFLERIAASILYYKGLTVRGQGYATLSRHIWTIRSAV